MIKINGKNLIVNPQTFQVGISDIDDGETTTRTADATMHRDRIAVKRKLELTWGALTWEQLSELLQSVSSVFFDVTYPDPMTGKIETKTFYVGDRQSPLAQFKANKILWRGLTMNWIER